MTKNWPYPYLNQILQAATTVSRRFKPIKSVESFTESEEALEKLDAICMQLIAIGESVKNLDKITEKSLLNKYPRIEWHKIMRIRDIISHHYFDIDAEVIFDVCANHIDDLATTIRQIIKDVSSDHTDTQ